MKTVELKQEHLDNGNVDDACSCPFALALRDAGIKVTSVGFCTARVAGSDTIYLDREADEAIHRLVRGLPVEPMEFRVMTGDEWRGYSRGIDIQRQDR